MTDTRDTPEAEMATALHDSGECENWEPGYWYPSPLTGERLFDADGDAAAHLRSARRLLAALPPGWCGHERVHPDAGDLSRNHYDWFMPNPPTDADFLADTKAKMTEALTDPFVHDMAQVVLRLLAEIARLRAALKGLSAEFLDEMPDADDEDEVEWLTTLGALRQARVALAAPTGEKS